MPTAGVKTVKTHPLYVIGVIAACSIAVFKPFGILACLQSSGAGSALNDAGIFVLCASDTLNFQFSSSPSRMLKARLLTLF